MNIYVDHSNFTCRQQPEGVGGTAANVSFAAIQPVSNPLEFMAALAAQAGKREPGAGGIELRRSIVLRPEDTAGYRLPMNISANRTLAIEGGEGLGCIRSPGTPVACALGLRSAFTLHMQAVCVLMTRHLLTGRFASAMQPATSRKAWTLAASRCCFIWSQAAG